MNAARSDITRQFQDTSSRLYDKRKPKSPSDLMALVKFPKDSTLHLAISEEIYERALDIVFRYANNLTYNLTQDSKYNFFLLIFDFRYSSY